MSIFENLVEAEIEDMRDEGDKVSSITDMLNSFEAEMEELREFLTVDPGPERDRALLEILVRFAAFSQQAAEDLSLVSKIEPMVQ